MATTFSINHTATAGFRLIGSRPVSFAVWMLVWLVLGMGPIVLAMAGLSPTVLDFIRNADSLGAGGADQAMAKVMAFEGAMLGTLGPWGLWSLVVQLVLFSALCRAMLEPEKRAFAYLRIGMDELRLLATELLLFFLIIAIFLVLGLVCGLFVWAGAAAGSPWKGWIIALGVIFVFAAAIYAAFKLSLAMPATFAEKQIRIFESLSLTRNRFWSIVGMWLLTLVFIIAISIVTGAISRVATFGLVMGAGGPQVITQGFSGVKSGADLARALTGVLQQFGPALALWFVFHGFVQAVVRVIATAPFVSAYGVLKGRPESV